VKESGVAIMGVEGAECGAGLRDSGVSYSAQGVGRREGSPRTNSVLVICVEGRTSKGVVRGVSGQGPEVMRITGCTSCRVMGTEVGRGGFGEQVVDMGGDGVEILLSR